MSEVKIFLIAGKIAKPNWKTNFRKEVRASKQEDAVEKIYKELGSKHRAKRFQIKILEVKEISPEEVTSPIIKKLVTEE